MAFFSLPDSISILKLLSGNLKLLEFKYRFPFSTLPLNFMSRSFPTTSSLSISNLPTPFSLVENKTSL